MISFFFRPLDCPLIYLLSLKDLHHYKFDTPVLYVLICPINKHVGQDSDGALEISCHVNNCNSISSGSISLHYLLSPLLTVEFASL